MTHRVRWLGLALIALSLLGCGPAAAGHEQSCRVEGLQGVCEGRFESMRGAHALAIAAPEIAPGQAVEVEAQVAVDRGAVRVAFAAPTGEESVCTARQDAPESVMGIATMGEGESLSLMLEALDGKAVGVTYMIAWAAAP